MRFDTFTATNTEPGEGPVREVVQDFRVEMDSPNIIFSAYRPETVFFPTSNIKIDPYATLRAPYQIPEGSAYSVISSVPNGSPDQLRSAGTVYPEEIADRYTQLPPTGLERTRALASRLTEGTTNPYDAVLKMNQYLKETYPYDLSIPPQMEEMDAVEYFLFEQKRGYCEQFLARRDGALPGHTGQGGDGLRPRRVQPVHRLLRRPGFGRPRLGRGLLPRLRLVDLRSHPEVRLYALAIQGGKVFGFMAKRLGEAAGPVATTAGTLVRGVARLDSASIIIVGLLVGGAYLVFFYTRKFIAYRSRETLVVRPIKVSDARLYSRYKKITTALEEIGIVRESQETPEQYARRAAQELDDPGMNRLGEIYLYARFRNAVPSTLVEEFDRLEPQTLAGIERSKEAQTVSTSARSG